MLLPSADRPECWPSLPLDSWNDTRATLHMRTQIVGKVRLANTPLVNHWWNVPLYVTARGLTTSLMPGPPGGDRPAFQIDLAFHDHELVVSTVDGRRAAMALRDRSVADFHAELLGMLDDLGVATAIWPVPV